MNNPSPQEQLRDIHLPDAVSQLPAIGWWLLVVLLLSALLAGFYFTQLRYRRRAYRRQACTQIKALVNAKLDAQQWLFEMNTVLKKTALQAYPQSMCQGLHGEDWQVFLCERQAVKHRSVLSAFSLLSHAYQPRVDLDVQQREAIINAALSWVQHHLTEAKVDLQSQQKGRADV